MIKEHELHEDVSMVYSRYYYADEQLNVLGVSEHQCVLPEGTSFLEYGNGAVSQFVTFKKKYYDQTVGISAHYKRAVDHALYYLLEEVGNLLFIDKPLYYYRPNTGNNISTNAYSDAAFFWHIIVMVDACKRRGKDVEKVVMEEFRWFVDGEKQDSFIKGEDAVRMTKTYRVGKKMLSLFKTLRR